MNDEELESGIQRMFRIIGDLDTYDTDQRRVLWKGIALGAVETVHHFIHGKKHGASWETCDMDTCRVAFAFCEAEGSGLL